MEYVSGQDLEASADTMYTLFKKLLMRRFSLCAIILVFLLPSCSNRAGGRTTMVVKPKNHHWWFNKKKDRRIKRTKLVRMRN